MLHGFQEATAIVAALSTPKLVQLSVHPQASRPTRYRLHMPTGGVIRSTSHQIIVEHLNNLHK